ncbi:tail fiber protein [Acidisoma cellulosilyticum]|nr:tail fiber protein [Acidisoma cellulosilyticum]
MAEPTTPLKGFTIPNTGDQVNAWGPSVNGNFSLIDSLLAGGTFVPVTTGTVTLTTAQTQFFRIILTGSLTGPVTVVVPQKASCYSFQDTTTRNGYSISITTSASGGRNQNIGMNFCQVFTDSASVWFLSPPANFGDMNPNAGLGVPPLYLACNGQAVSRTTYLDLFNTIGETYGSGDGSTTFNVPDTRGRSIFGPDAGAGRVTSASGFGSATIATSGGSELLQAHTHGITDPGHAHTVTDPGHNHTQNPHNHNLTDPEHTHGVNDIGHVHTYGSVGTAGSGQAGAANASAGGPGTTGSSLTGISIQSALTGITVNNATATNNSAMTGITIVSADTGISVDSTGGGGSQNMPPAILIPWIIYAGQ